MKQTTGGNLRRVYPVVVCGKAAPTLGREAERQAGRALPLRPAPRLCLPSGAGGISERRGDGAPLAGRNDSLKNPCRTTPVFCPVGPLQGHQRPHGRLRQVEQARVSPPKLGQAAATEPARLLFLDEQDQLARPRLAKPEPSRELARAEHATPRV